MDNQSLSQIRLMHPIAIADTFEAWNEVQASMVAGVQVTIAESYRTFQRSNQLYKLGRTVINPDGKSKEKPMGNIITWAKGGQSWHNFGLAFDFAMTTNHKEDWVVGPHWLKVVSIMKSFGWIWGGDFPAGKTDSPHFEKHYGRKLSQLQELYNQSEFLAGTQYVNITAPLV